MRTRSFALFVAVVASVSAAVPAHVVAEPASAQAETLFRRGRQLVAQGKLAEACTAFEGSQALEPVVTTLINLADCREKNGQLATAWGLYIEVQRELRARPQDPNKKLAKVAATRAARLEPRLSHLTIQAPALAGLEITRGGDKVDRGTWNQALPIDGGTYELVARAPDRVAWSAKITIAAEADARVVVVPALARRESPGPARASAPTEATAPASPTARASTAPAPRRAGRAPALITLGAGTAAVAGSLVVGILAQRRWHDARATCGGDQVCDDPAQAALATSLAHEARTRAWWATGLGATGAVALGVGTWLLLRSPGTERERRVQLAPEAGRDAIGVVAWGAF